MPFAIHVTNPECYTKLDLETSDSKHEELLPDWTKNLDSKEEFDAVEALCKSRCNIYVIPAMLVPARTNNIKNFSMDLFLPTFFSQALKVKNTVAKCFAILSSLIFDIATLPIRLLTAAPWVLINKKTARIENHPLHQYLSENHAPEKILAVEHLRVNLVWEETIKEDSLSAEKRIEHSKSFNINFIRSPIHEDFDYLNEDSKEL